VLSVGEYRTSPQSLPDQFIRTLEDNAEWAWRAMLPLKQAKLSHLTKCAILEQNLHLLKVKWVKFSPEHAWCYYFELQKYDCCNQLKQAHESDLKRT
jgi:hypothetical protein